MIISAPMNESELRNLMYTAQLPREGQAFAMRYPRGQGVMANWQTPMEEIKIGTGRLVKAGEDVAILTLGHIGNFALEACKNLQKRGIDPAHYDMRFAKPLDENMLHQIFSTFRKIITVEDGAVQGGFGSAILEFMAEHNYLCEIRRLGIPDQVVEHGEQHELYKEYGFDADGIEQAVLRLLEPVEKNKH
jgi:1-deoxy-D-xylulose-5-phosphate synthase